MALFSNLIPKNKFTKCIHYFPQTIFPRNSHNQPSKHFNPPQITHVNDSNINSYAQKLFDEMPKRDVESATALIGHFAKQNQHREAISCFLRMLHFNIKPNEYSFGTLLHSSVVLKDLHLGKQFHAYAAKINVNTNVYVGSAISDLYVKLSNVEDALRAFHDTHNPNVVSYTTLIRGYIKEERFDEALSIFHTMPEKNVVSWNTMISGYSQTGKNEEAVNFFVEMLRQGVTPSQYTYPCAMIAAANIGALSMGRSIHACAVKFLGKLGLFIANSLISFYAKCGSIEDSLLVFDKMPERNIVSWNALICGYAQNGEANSAIELYHEMKLINIMPNSVTLLGLLLACNHAGFITEGYKYFNEAREEYPSLLKPEHYACMIDLLSRAGRFQEAERFLHELPFDPGVGFWKALLGGCQVHSNLELGEIVGKKILELDPKDVSSYVMLSNTHSMAGRWGDVLDVRGKMREKGLRRIVGCSWIEVESKVHVFVMGDKRHGCKEEIYRALGCFLEHVMNGQDSDLVMEF